MRRGDVIIVSGAEDYGRPRPAVIVQTDAFPASHASVIVCRMTSEVVDASAFRVTIEPSTENGLRVRSQVMVDKPTTVRRARLGPPIGRLAGQEIAQLNRALAFVMGLAD
jgi:mRNA interferase MazF